jgi:hypothetical protein
MWFMNESTRQIYTYCMNVNFIHTHMRTCVTCV